MHLKGKNAVLKPAAFHGLRYFSVEGLPVMTLAWNEKYIHEEHENSMGTQKFSEQYLSDTTSPGCPELKPQTPDGSWREQ